MEKAYRIPNKSKELSLKVLLGAVLAVFGLAFLQYYFGYALWMGLVILLTYKTGVELNTDQKTIRSYWAVLGFYNGDWKSYKPYNALTIKSVNKSMRRYAAASTSMSTSETHYQLLLIDKADRRRKYILSTSKKKTEIRGLANHWCLKLQMPIVV